MPETSTMFGTLSGALTERALRVLTLAREEAQKLGYQFVSTEHLLLGVLAEGSGEGAELLKSRGLKLDETRKLIERMVGRGSGLVPNEMPFTPRARYAWEIAYDESEQLKHRDLDSVHILFGVVRECLFAGKRGGGAASVFKSLGVDLRDLEIEILTHLRAYGMPPQPIEPPQEEPRLIGSDSDPPAVDESPVDIPFQVLSQQPGPEIQVLSQQPGPEAVEIPAPYPYVSGEVRARLVAALLPWVEERDMGRVASSSPVRLATGDTLQVDVLFISSARIQKGGRIPELVALIAEVDEPGREAVLSAKLQFLLASGAQAGIIVYPRQSVVVARESGETVVLSGVEILDFPVLLPGWELPVERLLWPNIEEI